MSEGAKSALPANAIFPMAKHVERHQCKLRIGGVVIVGAQQRAAPPRRAGREAAGVYHGHARLSDLTQMIGDADAENTGTNAENVRQHPVTSSLRLLSTPTPPLPAGERSTRIVRCAAG